MSDPIVTTQTETSPQQIEGGSGNSTSYEPTDLPPTPPIPAVAGEKLLSIPTSSMTRIKRDAQEKGFREAETQFSQKLDRVARLMGFENAAEMEAIDPVEWRKRQSQSRPVEGSRTPPEKAPEKKEHPVSAKTDDGQSKRNEAEYQRALDKQRQLNRARAQEERRRKQAERELEAMRAETALRLAATRAGVQDVEYALHLLKQDMKGKSAEELSTFDEAEYFAKTLRQKHPYIYGTETRPATSGVDGAEGKGGAAPIPAKAGAGNGTEENGDGKTLNAKAMSKEEYKALLHKKGLTDPSVGMPS